MTNFLLNTDSYKHSHFKQYPPGTEFVYAYIESRGGAYDRTMFFGLQAFIKEYLVGARVTSDAIEEARDVVLAHGLPFNDEGWAHILNRHHGHLPIEIKAVREGSVIPNHNVLVSIVNTDPAVPWLTSFMETALLRGVWYPTTVGTVSWHMRKILKEAFDKTSCDPTGIDFKLHDFGARGVSSEESAAIGGAAHLVNFKGTDTMSALGFAKRYYNGDMAGFSIPAMEHSTVTSWSRNSEVRAYYNMIDKFGGGLYSIVADSYDIFHAVDKIFGDQLEPLIRSKGGTLVVRPDSGNPLTMPINIIAKLGEKFGYTTNAKGFKVLNGVRVIQGDGIDRNSLPEIIANLTDAGWSIDNLAFGMGGGLLQQVNRDTQKFAMKTSAAKVNGAWRDVFKDPITDPGKRSKRGILSLVQDSAGGYHTVPANGPGEDLLETVFLNGRLERFQTFGAIRDRAGWALHDSISK